MSGLVHIYTGNGKGKTTAALGLGLRALGRGFKVLMIQFLKGTPTGELHVVEKLGLAFKIHRTIEFKKFTCDMSEAELKVQKEIQQGLLDYAADSVISSKWDLIILDEVFAAITLGFISIEDVSNIIKNKPENLEIVLTGRNAPMELIDIADYVSEINPVKHPISKGISARKGIEF